MMETQYQGMAVTANAQLKQDFNALEVHLLQQLLALKYAVMVFIMDFICVTMGTQLTVMGVQVRAL